MLRRTLTTACSTLALLAAGAAVSAAEEQTPPATPAPAQSATPQPESPTAAAKPAATALPEAVRKTMRDAANPVVRMQTTLGDITIELYRKEAPKTVDNFLAYVRKKHYDGTIFHRVMPTFMIQGGGYTKDMTEKPQAQPIQNESANGLSNVLGTIAMARTDAPHSATAQFFINVKNNASLDKSRSSDGWGYCVFGKVIAGMDTVNQVKTVKTRPTDFSEGFPIVPVVIQSVTVLQ
jgi:cyclophilin family peptidyl-prolyl cis-trans isomerase